MKDTKTKSVSAFLQPGYRDLQTLLSKVKAIETLNHTLNQLLDPALKEYCQVANLTNGVLIILTANASVATELRYSAADLIKKLHKNHSLKHIREIQTKVRPPAPSGLRRGIVKKQPEKAALLSPETAETLTAMAETIEDADLREVMLRIAGHVK